MVVSGSGNAQSPDTDQTSIGSGPDDEDTEKVDPEMSAYLKRRNKNDEEEDIKVLDPENEASIDASPTDELIKGLAFFYIFI